MKRFSFLNRLPKKLVASLVLVAVVLGGASAMSTALIGGDREVKVYNGPGTPGFDKVTFNSFTNVPNIGDERDFFHGKITSAPNGFYDPMNGVRGGDEVLVRVYVHNGADPKHNAGGTGVAKNTRVRVTLPTAFGKNQVAHAFISADNAVPTTVEDTLTLTSDENVKLEYVAGSATIKTNTLDTALSDAVVAGGVQIGDESLNGNMKGCFEYVALVTFKVKVTSPSYALDKKVRLNGTPTFTESVVAQPGDKVDYALAFKNQGSTVLNNVVLGDRLPTGVTYVPGTTTWNSGHTNNKWTPVANENLFNGGIDTFDYAPNAAVYVRFTAQIPTADKLACGLNTFTNTGFSKPAGLGTIDDTAVVTVNRVCANVPAYSCDMFDINKGDNRTITVSQFKTSQTNGATFKDAVINWGDGTTALTTNTVVGQKHTFAKDGTYNVSVTARFTVNGQVVTANGVNCAKSVVFTTPGAPTSLPKTGAGDVIGLFGAATAAGALVHRVRASRRI